jgi:Fungal chitosanase of glycosyl hydrolase group 75
MIRKFPNDSAVFFRSGYCVNADGARHAYHRDNTGLDYLQNAGSPGDWWGIACDANGDPYIADTGYYVSTTSLCDSRFPESSPERYVDSETVPFYVLPGGKHFGAVLGDYAYVYNTSNGRGAGAIFADGGPADKIGEGSIQLAQLLNIPSNPKNGGREDGIIWVVFPGSRDEKIFPIDLNQLQARASRLFASWGGLGRLAEVYPQLIKPTQSPSQIISDVANLKPMPVLNLEDLAKEAESSIGTLSIGHRTCFKEKPLSSDTPGMRYAWVDPGKAEYEIVKRLPDEKGHYHLVLRLPSGREIDIYIYGLHAVLKIKGDDGNKIQAEARPELSNIKPVYDVRFTMDLSNSSELLTGKMEFRKNGAVYNEITVTSSLPGRQYSGAWERKGGLIVPTNVCEEVTGKGLSVKTTPIYMPDVRGVSGNFYPIEPFLIQTDGDERGDWGIHNDANMPGSLGCIVAETEKGWAAIQREFKVLEKLGVRVIDLIVEYS